MKKWLLTLILLLSLTSCLIPTDKEPLRIDPTSIATAIFAPTSTPEIILSLGLEDKINSLHGPLLLINDNTSDGNPLFILDVSSAEKYILEIPGDTSISSLGNALSPDQRSIILTRNYKDDPFQKDLLIFDIMTGKILHEIHIGSPSPIATKEMFSLLPQDVQREISDRNLDDWILNESLAGSLGVFRWSADSRSFYFSNSCENGYTCLYHYNMKVGEEIQLEGGEFFVQRIHLSPDGSRILLIKSPIPQLTEFPIINVSVLDPLLEVTHIPHISSDMNLTYDYAWLDANNLVISGFNVDDFIYSEIYQYGLIGNNVTLLSNDPFFDHIFDGNQLITLQFDQDAQFTKVSIKSAQNPDHLLNIPGKCIDLISSPIPGYIALVSCEQGLFGIDPTFVLTKISEFSGNFALSPDSQFFIQFSPSDPSISNDSIKLLDANFGLLREMLVPDVRQIIWQPDSLGFLYLSMEGLFRVQLPDGDPELLIYNNTDDYRHLDAVWFVN